MFTHSVTKVPPPACLALNPSSYPLFVYDEQLYHKDKRAAIEEEWLFPLLLRLFYCGGRSCLPKGCRSIAEASPKASPHQSESRRNRSAFIGCPGDIHHQAYGFYFSEFWSWPLAPASQVIGVCS